MKYTEKLEINIRRFYLNSFFNGMIGLMAPIIVIFQMKELGLSLSQIFIGEALFAGMILIAEIPSGIFADLYGRKKCLLFAEFMIVLALFVFSIATDFHLAYLGQMMFGVGVAFASGASDALLFDSLKDLNREKNYRKILGNLNTITFTSAIFSNIIAGFVAEFYDLRLPFILAGIVVFASLINLTFLTETKQTYSTEKKSIFTHFKSSVQQILGNKYILYIILFSTLLALSLKINFHILNPYWDLNNIPIMLFGIALAAHNTIASITSLFAPKIMEKFEDKIILKFTLVIAILSFALMSILKFGILGIILLSGMIQIVRALYPLIIKHIIHQHTESFNRATIFSFESFIIRGFQLILLPIYGYLTDFIGLLESLLIIAWILFFIGFIILWVIKKEEKETKT